MQHEHLVSMPLDFTPGGIIFDCDGTLADTMPLHYLAWREVLDAVSAPGSLFPEDQFYAWGGVSAREILIRLNELHDLTLPVDDLTHHKEMTYRTKIPLAQPIPAVLAEVHRFHGKVPLAVVSGGMPILVRETLMALGIADCFVTVIGSDDVQKGKPDPEGMLLAAARLGVAPSEIVVYEDADPGLLAAYHAGMRAVDIRRARSFRFSRA